MVRTRVGYSGGTRGHPTYSHLGDHTEALQVDYDPERTSFEELVEVFWKAHDPSRQSSSRQYQNVLFYHDDRQKRIALETRDRLLEELGQSIRTRIEPFRAFHVAEDYHQKYFLRNVSDLFGEFQAMYATPDGIRDSTAAARVNGYLGGNGSPDQRKEELDDLGLSEAGRERLRKRARGK